MKNKIFKPLSSFLVFLLATLVAFLSGCRPEAQKEKPNFVWILSEDNSKHYMALFDSTGAATPHIQAMAADGLLFTRAFSNAPVCSVARSTLISSCYAPRTFSQFHRRLVSVPMPDGLEMFPAYLRQAGYYTTNNSKEDYNYLKSDSVWDESSRTAHWMKRSAGQPFFHMESHAVSHEGRLHFQREFMESYQPVFNPDQVFLFPQHPDTELFRFTAAYYRDRMLSVDSIVGKVIQELREAGELENTFVFYFGDHGGVMPGSKGYAWESGLHVPLVVRVPENFRHLIQKDRGSVREDVVEFVDFGPTVLNLAGIPVPEAVDGSPFLGKESTAREPDPAEQISFGYADRFDEKYDMVRTLRRGNLKYMRSYQAYHPDALQNNYRYRCLAFREWRDLFHAGQLNEVQSAFFLPRDAEALYDLSADPYETMNLAADPAYREQVLELRRLLGDWVRAMPDLSFIPEPVLVRDAAADPVHFGQVNQEKIGSLVDVADLELLSYPEARPGISRALESDDPLERYWGLIVCSHFGKQALDFGPRALELCSDPDLLVRARAAEFLGLSGWADPWPHLKESLYASSDPAEVLLILNTWVLLMDGPCPQGGLLDEKLLAEEIRQDAQVKRRLEYIQSRRASVEKL